MRGIVEDHTINAPFAREKDGPVISGHLQIKRRIAEFMIRMDNDLGIEFSLPAIAKHIVDIETSEEDADYCSSHDDVEKIVFHSNSINYLQAEIIVCIYIHLCQR